MSWIRFEEREPSASGKTKRWAVCSHTSQDSLGIIAWYTPWRKYCFHPGGNTIYEQDCLRDIADFCEAATRNHRPRSTPDVSVKRG
jgi:hypothetical protein